MSVFSVATHMARSLYTQGGMTCMNIYVVSEIEKVQDSLLVFFAKGKGEDLWVKWSVSVFA